VTKINNTSKASRRWAEVSQTNLHTLCNVISIIIVSNCNCCYRISSNAMRSPKKCHYQESSWIRIKNR